MAIWLPDFIKINSEKKGFDYSTKGPYRLVLHTTETKGLGDMPTTHENPPHLWVDLDNDTYLQAIPLDLASFSLRHPGGTIDTNGIFCIQVEIVGYAKDTHNYSDEWYKKLALNVIKPICETVGIDYKIYKEFKGEGDEVLATVTSTNRMSADEWVKFNGVCGHQHIPNNTHWDPGQLQYEKVIELIKSSQLVEA